MKLNHILTCIDLSPQTQRLVEISATLAERLGASLTLFHADPKAPAGVAESEDWRAFAERYAAARERATGALSAILEARDLRYDFATGAGPARRAVLEAVHQHRADLVILGTGVTADGAGMGATAARLLRLADVPVLVVPTRGEPPQHPWSCNRILAPTDFQETSEAGLRAVRDLAHQIGAGVSVATVVRWPQETGLLAVQDGAAQLPEVIASLVERAKQALVEQARGVGLTTALPHVVGGERPADALVSLAVELGADLIALPSLGKGAIARILLGSTTERLVRISPIPVLVFPRAALVEALPAGR